MAIAASLHLSLISLLAITTFSTTKQSDESPLVFLCLASVTGCAWRINDMLVGGMIGGVTRLTTPHNPHSCIELSDRTSVLLISTQLSCSVVSMLALVQ